VTEPLRARRKTQQAKGNTMSISPELKAKIDVLINDPELQAKLDVRNYDDWKEAIIERLTDLGEKDTTDEESFEKVVSGVMEHQFQLVHSPLRIWRDDEVLAFIDYFKKEAPQKFSEFLGKEPEGYEILTELWGFVRAMAEKWHPGLHFADYAELIGKIRDVARAKLI
jgi:hypothetical protein